MDGHDVNTMNTRVTLKTNRQFHSKKTSSFFIVNFLLKANETEVKDEKTCRGRVAVVVVSSSPRKLTSGFFFDGITTRRKYMEYSVFSVVFLAVWMLSQ